MKKDQIKYALSNIQKYVNNYLQIFTHDSDHWNIIIFTPIILEIAKEKVDLFF